MIYLINMITKEVEQTQKVFRFKTSDYVGGLLNPEAFNLLVDGLNEIDPALSLQRSNTSLDTDQAMKALEKAHVGFGLCTGFEFEDEPRWVEYQKTSKGEEEGEGEGEEEGEEEA